MQTFAAVTHDACFVKLGTVSDISSHFIDADLSRLPSPTGKCTCERNHLTGDDFNVVVMTSSERWKAANGSALSQAYSFWVACICSRSNQSR